MAKYKSIHTGPQIDSGVSRALNPDTVPTAGSSNLITSGGTKSALDSKADQTDLASIHATGSTNATGAGIPAGTYFYLNGALVQAIQTIATGATFTSETNYSTITAGALNGVLLMATISSKATGNFTYSRFGHMVVGCGTIKAIKPISAYENIVTGLPRTPDGLPYMGVFITDNSGYNQFYINGTAITTRIAWNTNDQYRLLIVYMCE